MKSTRLRIIAFICAMCMFGTWCLEGMPAMVKASETTETATITDLKEQGYDYWTLKDFSCNDTTLTGAVEKTKASTTMDKSIFTAKIEFTSSLSSSQYSFGTKDSSSKWQRFFFGKDSTGLYLRYHNGNGVGDMLRTSQTDSVGRVYFTDTNAGVTLLDNKNLAVSIATEFINQYQTDGVNYVDMKVGFYFDDTSDDIEAQLYNNQYYYIMGQKEEVACYSLLRFDKASTESEFAIASNYLWERELNTDALQRDGYDYWTLRDFAIADKVVPGDTIFRRPNTSMDDSVFTTKINFSSSTTTSAQYSFGAEDSNGKLHRFFFGKDTSGLYVRYHHGAGTGDMLRTSQTATAAKVYFTDTDAGVTLLDNPNLAVSIATNIIQTYQDGDVNYVDMQVAFYFDDTSDDKEAKLYNNQYYYVIKQEVELTQWGFVQFYNSKNESDFAIASNHLWDAEEVALKDEGYDYWTMSDVGIVDQSVNTQVSGTKTVTSANKTIFTTKAKFISGMGGWDVGYDGSVRFCISAPSDVDNLRIRYFDLRGASSGATAIMDKEFTLEEAGCILRSNPELTISISVETVGEPYTWEATGAQVIDLKVGVFFNGRLYNDTYIDVEAAEVAKLEQKNVVIYANSSTTDTCSMASNYLWERELNAERLKEEGYDYFTLNDFGIMDGAVPGDTTLTKLTSDMDKSIFSAKIKFSSNMTTSAQYSFGTKDSNSKWQRFFFGKDSTGLYLRYHNGDGTGDMLYSSRTTGKGRVYFTDANAGVTLTDNANLATIITTEIIKTYQTDGVDYQDMKVGIYFDDTTDNKEAKLYNNQYYYIIGQKAELLEWKYAQFYNSASETDFVIASHYLWERELEANELKEEGYDYWTLSDVGIADQTMTSTVTSEKGVRDDTPLDKTIFTAQIEFPTDNVGVLQIGDDDGTCDIHRFRFNEGTSGAIRFRYFTKTSSAITHFDEQLTSEKAGVALRGNENLVFSIVTTNIGDVYTSGDYSVIDMQVGLYFDDLSDEQPAMLYNNQYFRVTGANAENTKGTMVTLSNSSSLSYDIASNYLWDRTDATEYDKITFRDFGIADGKYGYNYTTSTDETTGEEVKTLALSTEGTYDAGALALNKKALVGIVKYSGDASAKLDIAGTNGWYGLQLRSDVDNDRLVLKLKPDSAGYTTNYYLYSNMAGTDLIDNKFTLKMTFLFVDKDGDGTENDLQLGIYFNEKLYGNNFFYFNNYIGTSDDYAQEESVLKTKYILGNHFGVLADDGGYVRVASDRSDLGETIETYNLNDGGYLVTGEENVKVTPLNGTETEYTDVNSYPTLTSVGEYFISACDDIYEKWVYLYRPYDACPDDEINVKDLVVAKKLEQSVTPNCAALNVAKIAADMNESGTVDTYDVSSIREKLCDSSLNVQAAAIYCP